MGSPHRPVVTRFAPSPTGYLHIGGARTALFNWLFARHHSGRFLLRIEDTDRQRSTEDAIRAILDGLAWLGLDWDGEAVSQFARADRHREVAEALRAAGHAYHCYASQEEIRAAREKARAAGKPLRFNSPWRDRDPSRAPAGAAPVLRFKAPREGETVIDDKVQGTVRVPNSEIDDMILLRSDGTPTYMLSVVVDDHDMGVTHVIRGDDHLTNAFRQLQIIRAMGWEEPVYAHIPLIHGPDGKKLSKRHGALGVAAYREMGYLPEAMRNYLLRLGWGHGDTEIISTGEAIRLFSLEGIGRGPARFDFKKLANFNGHYIRLADDARLTREARPFVEKALGRPLKDAEARRLKEAMPGLKARARTLIELAEASLFLFKARPLIMSEAADALLDDMARERLAAIHDLLQDVESWNAAALEEAIKAHAAERGLKLGAIAQPLRAALTGSTVSPGIFDVLAVLGKEESLARLRDQMTMAGRVGKSVA
ncbi:MAG: glutamate--tRNA ligase [Rhodothalassiaceae bacterium]